MTMDNRDEGKSIYNLPMPMRLRKQITAIADRKRISDAEFMRNWLQKGVELEGGEIENSPSTIKARIAALQAERIAKEADLKAGEAKIAGYYAGMETQLNRDYELALQAQRDRPLQEAAQRKTAVEFWKYIRLKMNGKTLNDRLPMPIYEGKSLAEYYADIYAPKNGVTTTPAEIVRLANCPDAEFQTFIQSLGGQNV